MIRGLKNAASALQGQQMKLDVTAHNLANVNTVGYQKKELLFQDLLYQQAARPGHAVAPAPPGEKEVTVGAGVAMTAIRTAPPEGSYQETGRELDLALSGDGYLRVLLPDGREAYTRAGNLHRDSAGRLTTAQGYPLAAPPLPPETKTLQISAEGQLTVETAAGEIMILGHLAPAYFNNAAGLQNLGDNLFAATVASGAARAAGPGENTHFKQGYLAGTNVALEQEMLNLLTAQRSFSLNARLLQTFDEMLDLANNLRR